MLPCLLCDRTFANADTVIDHVRRQHVPAIRFTADVYGQACPLCGKGSFQRLDQHTSRTHRQQVALAFAEARQDGDLHGVVVARIHHLIDQELSELEEMMRLS